VQFLVTVFYQVQCALFYIENDAEIFPAHYTWKVAQKGFKIAFMMDKLVIFFLKNKNTFFAKNHCQIQVRTKLVSATYSIKYGS
jgi:hypothetical protein